MMDYCKCLLRDIKVDFTKICTWYLAKVIQSVISILFSSPPLFFTIYQDGRKNKIIFDNKWKQNKDLVYTESIHFNI